MVLETKNSGQEDEIIKSKGEENKEKENKLSLEQALLEAQRLIEEMEKHCKEITMRLAAEGKESGLSSKEIKEFKEEIEATLANLSEIKKEFEEELSNLEAQLPLAEFTPSINKEEVAGKIEEIGAKKGDMSGAERKIKRIKEEISNVKEKVLSKEQEAQKEKEKKLKKASVEIEKVVLGKIHGSEASKNKDERGISYSDESIQKVNNQYYDRFSNAVLETQPELVQEIIQKRLAENPNLEKGFKPSEELQAQQTVFETTKDKLNLEQIKEVEEGLKKKEKVEKNRWLFDAGSFETLLREGKVDVEKLCDNLAGGINVFDTKYLDNVENTKYDALFMPGMVMEKVIDNMSDEDIFKATGERANRIEDTIKNKNFSDYDKKKKIADLYFNFTSHPKFNERLVNSKIGKERDNYWEQNYKKSYSQIVELGGDWTVKSTIEASDRATQRRNTSYGEVDKGKVVSDQIFAERDNLLKKVQAEKDKLQEYEQKIREATKQGDYPLVLSLTEEVSKMKLEQGDTYSGVEGKLKDLEEKEAVQRKQMEDIYIDKIVEIGINNEKNIDVKKEYSDKTVDFIKKADLFNQRVTKLEIDQRKPIVSKEDEEKKSKQKQEAIESSKNNYEKKKNIVEKQKEEIFKRASETMIEKMALPDLQLNWSNLKDMIKEIYEEKFKMHDEEYNKFENWLNENENPKFGFLGKTEVKDPFTGTGENVKVNKVNKEDFANLRTKVEKKKKEANSNFGLERSKIEETVFTKMKDYYDNLILKLQEAENKKKDFLSKFKSEDKRAIEWQAYYGNKNKAEMQRAQNLFNPDYNDKPEYTVQRDFKQQWGNIQKIIKNSEYKDITY